MDWFTGRTDGAFNAGADGSARMTLPELLGIGKGGFGGNFNKNTNLSEQLTNNIKNNGLTMAAQVIGIPIAFRLATKLLRKPIINPANKIIKMAGLGKDVKL
jgi:hypothetical protein